LWADIEGERAVESGSVADSSRGTTTLRDTINASMREVVDAKRRLELIEVFGQAGRFDFDAADGAWGADAEVWRRGF
jgi:hypothetical protein